jgi:hypothetical protein
MNLLANFFRCHGRRSGKSGVAAVEFALTMPIWITLLLGVCDGAYCMLVNERTDRIAYTVTDVVTQYQVISIADLNDITLAAGQIMQPLEFDNKGTVVISSVHKPTGEAPIIKWQYKGGGTLNKSSLVGSVGGAPTLPNGLTLNDNDNVIISEVFYNFTPLFIASELFSANLRV